MEPLDKPRLSLWESVADRLFAVLPKLPVTPPEWPDNLELQEVALDFPDALADPTDPAVEDLGEAMNADEYGDLHREEARRAVRKHGIEAIAFYAPITVSGMGWGIYYNEPVFWGVVSHCAHDLRMNDKRSVAVEVLRVIDWHEQFHAGIELLALVRDDHRYWPLQFDNVGEQVRILPSETTYTTYHSEVYQRTWPTSSCLEEGLATANQFRTADTPVSASLARMLEAAPPAYASWSEYRAFEDFDAAHHRLAAQVMRGECDWLAARNFAALVSQTETRLWLPPTDRDGLECFGAIQRWVWRADRRVPTFFSRGIFGNLRTRQFVNCLCSRFGALIQHGGRHPCVLFADGAKVPYSSSWSTVPPFFVRQVAGAVGVSQKELLDTCA